MKKKRNESVWESRLEAFDNVLLRVLERRRESIEKSMSRSLSQEALRCIFIASLMFLDTFILLQILLDVPEPFGFILFGVILGIALYVEIRIYNSIWGKNGCWSIEKHRRVSKKID